ncbi:MAG: ribosome biogenesis GTPase YlqF [Ruminococcaceae bacterium]|nr:ribosome biogenesis GTPase YlqF [Oscillospiraceae bacterium]
MTIVWYPGHMAAAKRKLKEKLPLVDFVIELLDSRVPLSSRNPDIRDICGSKPIITLLTKSSLCDNRRTNYLINQLEKEGRHVISIDCKTGKNVNLVNKAIREVLDEKIKRFESKGMTGRRLRGVVVGITNVGKSTFINAFTKTSKAKAEDRPGVTRELNWVSSPYGIDLLDTPGLLWHKFDDPEVGVRLALTGAVRDEILDIYHLSFKLIENLKEKYPELLCSRYKITISEEDSTADIFDKIGRKRGFLISGGEIDADRLCVCLLDEFRGGKIGNITLD